MERIRQGRIVDRIPLPRRDVLRSGGLLIGALGAPALLSGCGTSAARAGNVLRISQPRDPKTLDPQKQGDMVSMNVLINMFDTLTTRGRDNQLHPRLALSWAATDTRTWRFRFRPGVTFHNGEACEAQAVAFSIKRLLDPATKSPIVELRYVEGVTVVDRFTVDFHTTVHDPILPAKLSLFGGVVVPPRYLSEVGDAGFAEHPVGTGPFTFVSWQRDHELRMRAYAGHWQGRPSVDGLVFSPAPNASSSLASLQSGDVDLVAGLTPDAAQQLDGYSGITLDGFTGIRTSYLSLNTADARGGTLRLPLPDRQHLRPQRPAPLETGLRRRPGHGERGGLPMSDLTLDRPPAPAAEPRRDSRAARLALFVLRRLGTAVFVLLCTATVAFFLVRLSGDPVKILLPPTPPRHRRAHSAPPSAWSGRCSRSTSISSGGCPASTSAIRSSTASPSAGSSPTGCPPRSNSPPRPWR
ncbi:ABC transporter substrate-binding protein [Streptomyces sp. MMS24-I2-30]|uniref:ABC transporter substrate-binding protein n=1 Tax=Streptomyces sp. MMS24-I2-30 TaxID=3351564 RepID=UPI003896EEAD